MSMRKPLNDHYRSVFSVAMEEPVRVPASGRPTPPAPQAPQFAGATSEALANELKARRKAAREEAARQKLRAAAVEAERARHAEYGRAATLRCTELNLLHLMEDVEGGGRATGLECFATFEKELAPLAKQFGFKLVRIGMGDRCTVVKINEATK